MTSKTNETAATLEAVASPLLGTSGAPIDIEALKDLCDAAGSDFAVIANDAKAIGVPETIPVFINRKTGKPESVKALFDEWRTVPTHRKGTAVVNTLESFVALTERHATPDSVIFADTNWRQPSLTTIVDYHSVTAGGSANNCSHRIRYPFPLTEEWQAWVAIDGKPMNQGQFAEFIEDHRADLAAPHEDEISYWQEMLGGKVAYPNELQMLSRGLKINAETKASSAVTLATGEGELTWEETHTARDTKGGKIIVPSLFMVSVAPFYQGEKARMPARLRYRMPQGGGSVAWSVHLYRPDIYVTEQVTRDLDRTASDTGLPAFQGKSELG